MNEPEPAHDRRFLTGTEPMSAHPEEQFAKQDVPSGFANFDILGTLGQGGMGVVYKARQVDLDRIVALKVIRAGAHATESEILRFHAESRAAAQLDHPGIIKVHEVGDHEGQPYLSMGYVEGESLGDRLTQGPLPPREAAAICRKVAEAVHYAHQRGVIHRDLKPSNILIDAMGEPRLTDFGLSKENVRDTDSGAHSFCGLGYIIVTVHS